MGIVIRQSLYSSVFGYAGTVIGYVNVVLLMPLFLELDEIGLFRTIISITMLLSPFAMMGAGAGMQRFFPGYSEKRNQLIMQTFGVVVFGYLLVSTLLFIFQTEFFSFFAGNADRVNDYFALIPIFIGSVVLFTFFESFSKSNLNIVVPNLLRDVFYKSFTMLTIFAYGLKLISFATFIYAQALIYFLLAIFLFYHVSSNYGFLKEILNFAKVEWDSSLIMFSLFSLMSGMGMTLVMQIDQIMVSKYLGLALNGIYTTAIFMAVAIELPRRFVSQISYQILSNLYQEKKMESIEKHYKSASINQAVLGAFLFILLVANIENIYRLMPNGEDFSSGIWVLYIFGFTKLMSMTFSLGGEIISVSDYYKYNVFLVISLGVVTVVTNLLLIPQFGMVGAAAATFLSFLFYDVSKFILVRVKLKIQPFSLKTFKMMVITGSVIGLHVLTPYMENVFLDIAIRSVLLGGGFLGIVYYLTISDEVNDLIAKSLNLIRFQ